MYCPCCGEKMGLMGILGSLIYFTCRACGSQAHDRADNAWDSD